MPQLGLGHGLGRSASEESATISRGFANAYSFLSDGSNDTVNMGTLFTHQQAFTLSAWVYPTSTGGTQRILDRDTSYYLTWDETTNEKFEFAVYGGGGYNRVESTGTYALNNWYHVVGTHSSSDSSNSVVKLGSTQTAANTQLLEFHAKTLVPSSSGTHMFVGTGLSAYFCSTVELSNISTIPVLVFTFAGKVNPSGPNLFLIMWNLPVLAILSSTFLLNDTTKSAVITF